MLRKLGRLMTCREASRAISQMQDRKLSLPLYVRLRLHLIWCEACRRVMEQMGFLRAAMRHYKQ